MSAGSRSNAFTECRLPSASFRTTAAIGCGQEPSRGTPLTIRHFSVQLTLRVILSATTQYRPLCFTRSPGANTNAASHMSPRAAHS